MNKNKSTCFVFFLPPLIEKNSSSAASASTCWIWSGANQGGEEAQEGPGARGRLGRRLKHLRQSHLGGKEGKMGKGGRDNLCAHLSLNGRRWMSWLVETGCFKRNCFNREAERGECWKTKLLFNGQKMWQINSFPALNHTKNRNTRLPGLFLVLFCPSGLHGSL